MLIVVGSTSAVKINAVIEALKACSIQADVLGVKADSNVNEQPLNDETLRGARIPIYGFGATTSPNCYG